MDYKVSIIQLERVCRKKSNTILSKIFTFPHFQNKFYNKIDNFFLTLFDTFSLGRSRNCSVVVIIAWTQNLDVTNSQSFCMVLKLGISTYKASRNQKHSRCGPAENIMDRICDHCGGSEQNRETLRNRISRPHYERSK